MLHDKNGDLVYSEDFSSALQKWIPGIIEKVTGAVSDQIRPENGQIMRRHVDSVRTRFLAQANPRTSSRDTCSTVPYQIGHLCVLSKHKQQSGKFRNLQFRSE